MITSFTKYKCSDGKIYDTLAEAQVHENMLSTVQVYKITYVQNDENKSGYVLVHCFTKHALFVEEWCYKTYGNRIKFKDNMYTNDKLIEVWTFTKSTKKVTDLTESDTVLAKIEEALISDVF